MRHVARIGSIFLASIVMATHVAATNGGSENKVYITLSDGTARELPADGRVFVMMPSATNGGNVTVNTNVEQHATAVSHLEAWRDKITAKGKEFRDWALAFYDEHKYKIFAGAGLSLYLALQLRLTYLSQSLSQKNLWSQWLESSSLQDLFSVSQDVLTGQLLQAIQLRYGREVKQGNAFERIRKFLNDVEDEQEKLEDYLWWVGKLEACYLSKILFYSKKLVASAQERQNRLAYLKSCVENWMNGAHYFGNSMHPEPVQQRQMHVA